MFFSSFLRFASLFSARVYYRIYTDVVTRDLPAHKIPPIKNFLFFFFIMVLKFNFFVMSASNSCCAVYICVLTATTNTARTSVTEWKTAKVVEMRGPNSLKNRRTARIAI